MRTMTRPRRCETILWKAATIRAGGESACCGSRIAASGFSCSSSASASFEGRSDKTLIPHTPEQNAHVVAHQRIDAKHQYFGLDLGGFHRRPLARTVFQASTATT